MLTFYEMRDMQTYRVGLLCSYFSSPKQLNEFQIISYLNLY
jgi:hypothetical protein